MKFADLDRENVFRQIQQLRCQLNPQQIEEQQLLMGHDRQHADGSEIAVVYNRHGKQEEQQQTVMVQERQIDHAPQQQLLMIQGQHDQAYQQFVIIQDRREPDQPMLHYEFSQCDEKDDVLQPQRHQNDCEQTQLQVVTIGSDNATILNQPVFYNPAAHRTYPMGVSFE